MAKRVRVRDAVIMWGVLLAGFFWLAVKIAMAYSVGISYEAFTQEFTATLKQPFSLQFTEHTAGFSILFICAWFMLLAYYLIMAGKYRRGAEYGSAAWGNVREIHNRYKQKHNIILSENLVMGMDKPVKNKPMSLNTLIVGGTGSRKSTGIIIPNLLEMHSNAVVVDCVGEILASTGSVLKDKGYNIKVLNLKDLKNSELGATHKFG